jgi:hypothetical protein
MLRVATKYPNIVTTTGFGKNPEPGRDDTNGSIHISPSRTDILAYIDTRLANHAVAFKLKCVKCSDIFRVYPDLDRPTSEIVCSCDPGHKILRDVEAMKDKELKENFEFTINCLGDQWPVKVDRLTAPSGLQYTGTRDCTRDEAIEYFLGSFNEAKKRGFRKPPTS